jgi:Putative ABC exporter
MIPAPLRLLLTLQMRARVRRMLRGAKTVKGALYLLLMLGVFGLWIGPSLVFGFIGVRSDGELIRSYLAMGLFGYCLLTLSTMSPDSGVQFLPAEVDFLFPAPFRRRELLMYRLAGMGLGCVLMALFFSVFLLQHVSFWAADYLGILLALWFIVLVQTSLALVIALVAESAYTRARRAALLVATGLFLLTAVQSLRTAESGGFLELVRQFRGTWAGMFVLAPFEVFARTITAQTFFPDLIGWGAAALIIDGLLVAFVLRVDADFMENSVRTSQKLYERLQRARQGGALANLVKSRDVQWRLPQLPWLGGAGPIAWRQLTTALRSTRGLVIMLTVIGLATLGPTLVASRTGSSELSVVFLLMPLVMLSTFFLPQMLQFDFRGDIDRLDVLKALPLPATSIVLGQLVAPVLMASLIQLLMLSSVAIAITGWSNLIVAVVILLPLTNVLIFAIENLVFLLFPTRMTAIGTGDMQAVGRHMLLMFVKMVTLALTAGLAAAGGGLAWLIAGKSTAAMVGGAALAVVALGAALVPCLGFAFRRFDPSRDTPD